MMNENVFEKATKHEIILLKARKQRIFNKSVLSMIK